jgi:septal ring factor EnvC (AmiA/AmiB activator)
MKFHEMKLYTMSYTLGTAAKATGKSRATIQRAIKNGKISAKKNEFGQYEIDPAEILRVYPAKQPNETDIDAQKRQLDTVALQVEIDILTAERERERRQYEDTLKDLRARLDRSDSERERVTRLLTSQHEKKGFLKRMFG